MKMRYMWHMEAINETNCCMIGFGFFYILCEMLLIYGW